MAFHYIVIFKGGPYGRSDDVYAEFVLSTKPTSGNRTRFQRQT